MVQPAAESPDLQLPPAIVHGPGKFFLFQRFADFKTSCGVLLGSSKDWEARLDALVQICGDVPGFLYSSIYLGDLATSILALAKLSHCSIPFKTFARILPPLGLAVSGFDGIFTLVKLNRTSEFLQSMLGETFYKEVMKDTSLENVEKVARKYAKTIQESEPLQKTLDDFRRGRASPSEFLQELAKTSVLSDLLYLERRYMPVAPEEVTSVKEGIFKRLVEQDINTIKRRQLAGRVQEWCQKRVSNELPTILEGLKSDDETAKQRALEEGKALLKTVKTQGEKAKSVHIISLMALTLTGIGFAAMLIGCPYVIPVFFLALGFIGTLGADTIASSTLYCEGRQVKMSNCIPSWFKKYILWMDLEKDGKAIIEARDLLQKGDIQSATHLIDKIEDSYLRAHGYHLVTKVTKSDELLNKIKELSLFYFHRAEEALLD